MLEQLLAAENAKDNEAVRRYVTAGTRLSWDRDARENNDPSLRTVLGNIGRVEIESLRVDPHARWAVVTLKNRGLPLDLRRENDAWKVGGEQEDVNAMQNLFLLSRRILPPVPPSPTLSGKMLAQSDLPAGWNSRPNEAEVMNTARLSYVSEVAAFNFVGVTRGGSLGALGSISYRLIADEDLAAWQFWSAEARGWKPSSDDIGSLYMLDRGMRTSRVLFKRGRVVVEVSVAWDSVGSATKAREILDGLVEKAVARLK